MRGQGAVGIAFVALIVSACGVAQNRNGAPADHLQPAPPIEAIDEPAANRFFPPEDLKIRGKQGEQARRLDWEDRREVMPADPWEMRSIARLRLKERGPKDQALLTVWQVRGRLCVATDLDDSDGTNGGYALGPCLVAAPCADLCLARSGHYDPGTPPWVLSGVVEARADHLRIVLADGQGIRYPLTGPLVPGFPDWRVFMLDLGRRSHRALELLRDEKVVAHEDEPSWQVAEDRCTLTYSWPEQEREFNTCMDKADAAAAQR